MSRKKFKKNKNIFLVLFPIISYIVTMKKNNNDPFGFNKAINWEKLEEPEIIKQLEKLFEEKEKENENKPSS